MAIRRVAVLGAGTMGAGIAQACAQAGLDVTLRDLKDEFLDRGLQRLRAPLDKRVAAGKATQAEVDGIFARITTTTSMADAVKDADLIIEAVFEDLKVKKEVFAEADQYAPATCLFATNTSSLKVGDLAAATQRPDRFGGLHFFFPAQINKLLEVVGTDHTSEATLQALYDFARSIGKVPVKTTDSEGFCVNRFFVPWVNESVRILDEGVADIATIDAAAKAGFDIGMGPFQLMNVTGVPISLHAERTLHQAFGAAYAPAAGLVRQVEDRKADWDLSGEPDEDRFKVVQDRLMGVVFGIVAKLVDEGVCSEAETDKAAVVGLAWKRGPFSMMNKMGTKSARKLVKAIHEPWGDDFPLAANLDAVAESDGKWSLPAVRVDRVGDVATVTIQRPGTMNALSPFVLQDIERCLTEVASDDSVRVVVLTGEGSTFIAGADIKAMMAMSAKDADTYSEQGHRVAHLLATMPKPTIAAVNGHCYGGGLELALACDMLIAADTATLGLPEVTLGIQPGFGGSARLPRVVGVQRAKELIFTGRRFSGTEAAAMGVAVAAIARAELYDVVGKHAATMAANAPLAVASAKRTISEGMDKPLDKALKLEIDASSRLFRTEDKAEGMKAFAQRRQPVFKGE